MAVEITAQEQLLVELLNRARLDPLGEAARYGIELNAGLAPGTLDGKPMQVLAPNALLDAAAEAHTLWMLSADTFSHTGDGGSQPVDRVQDAGYTLSGAWTVGENIAAWGSSAGVDLTAAILAHHKGLFLSPGHRENILNPAFREVGVAQDAGPFTFSSGQLPASLLTEDFAAAGSAHFLTGVAYDDSDGNGFYSIGEAVSGVQFMAQGVGAGTLAAGGYALALTPDAAVTVDIAAGALAGEVVVDLAAGNVKLDLVDGGRLMTSGTLTLVSGIADAGLLGVGDAGLTGNAAANHLTGNAGDNVIVGGGGFDSLEGGGGNDTITGGNGRDKVWLGTGDDIFHDNGQGGVLGRDTVWGGSGHDTIQGGNGNDAFHGQAGNDLILGRLGNDRLYGNNGADTVKAGNGADRVEGGGGNDRLAGQAGNDVISGEAGNDRLFGGAGADTLAGGAGNDRLTGGAGADAFVFHSGGGTDHVTDFDGAAGDLLMLDAALTGGESDPAAVLSALASVTADGVVFSLADGSHVTLDGLTGTAGLDAHLVVVL